jgi:hypothetical protein
MSGDDFVSEPLEPVPGTADPAGMSRGEPGLPQRFTWRGREHRVIQVLRIWKTSGRERGGTEIYLRRHWYEIETDTDLRMTVYCDRQAQNRKRPKARWWVYTAVGTDGRDGPIGA